MRECLWARRFHPSLLLHPTCVRSCCNWRASCVQFHTYYAICSCYSNGAAGKVTLMGNVKAVFDPCQDTGRESCFSISFCSFVATFTRLIFIEIESIFKMHIIFNEHDIWKARLRLGPRLEPECFCIKVQSCSIWAISVPHSQFDNMNCLCVNIQLIFNPWWIFYLDVCVALFYVPILGNQCTVPGFHQGEPRGYARWKIDVYQQNVFWRGRTSS